MNKIDRADARPVGVLKEVFDLFGELDAHGAVGLPRSVRERQGRLGVALRRERQGDDLRPLFELILGTVPPPSYAEGHGLQALVTNLDASPYVGRLALCRVHEGAIERGQTVAWCRRDGIGAASRRSPSSTCTEGMTRVDADRGGARGDHRAGRPARGDDRGDDRRSRPTLGRCRP